MKKKLLLVLMLIAAVVVMPRVSAEEASKAITLGEVTDITNEDTLKSGKKNNTVVSNDDHSVVTITYDEATFRLLVAGTEETGSTGRDAGYAWIGLKVAKATNATNYVVTFNGVADPQAPAADIEDYIGFNAEELKKAANEGKNLEFTYDIEWSSTESGVEPVKQSITIVVVPKGIVLQAQDYDTAEEGNKKEVWNAEEYAKEIKKVNVTVKAMKDGKEVELPETVTKAYELKEVYTLTEEQLSAIKAVLTDENLELVGLYTDEELKTEFDATKALDADVTVYVAYKTKVEEPAPNTVDNAVMYIALAGASLLATGGIAVYFKKVNE